MNLVKVSSYYSDSKALNLLYFPRLVLIVQPNVVNPHSSFDRMYDLNNLSNNYLGNILRRRRSTWLNSSYFDTLSICVRPRTNGYCTYKPKQFALSTHYNLSESNDMKKSSNWKDWSWNLILIIIMTLDFLPLVERQVFENHLVIGFIHGSSSCFSSSTLSTDAYMVTSSANILRTHHSKV